MSSKGDSNAVNIGALTVAWPRIDSDNSGSGSHWLYSSVEYLNMCRPVVIDVADGDGRGLNRLEDWYGLALDIGGQCGA